MSLVLAWEDAYCTYLWKPAGIASSWWSTEHFLDIFSASSPSQVRDDWSLRSIDQWQRTWFDRPWVVVDDMSPLHDFSGDEWVAHQQSVFDETQEFGLLNRLDVATSWYLYFAKHDWVYRDWSLWQSAWYMKKIYMWYVAADISYMSRLWRDDPYALWDADRKEITLSWPLMHHQHLSDRMVASMSWWPVSTWRGRLQEAKTVVRWMDEHPRCVYLSLVKGCRHQLRVHLAAAGYPLVGDVLYGKPKHAAHMLYLWSRWVERITHPR